MPEKKQANRRKMFQKETKKESVGEIAPEAQPEAKVPESSDAVLEQHEIHSFQAEVGGESVPIKRSFFSKSTLVMIFAFLLLIVAFVVAAYFYLEYQKVAKLAGNSSATQSAENDDLIQKISKLIELPTGEEPTVATVSDGSKLPGQVFVENAKNGDKVLVYANAKKAYLYRPSTNKLIDVVPVTIPAIDETSASASAQTASEEVKVVLLNGSGVTGITLTAQEQLTSDNPKITITARENANRRDYENTIVIDLTGKPAAITEIIESLGVGKKGALPTGEEKPEDGDVLVILGADYE